MLFWFKIYNFLLNIGVGYIEKVSRSKYRWTKNFDPAQVEIELLKKNIEYENLINQEKELDYLLNMVRNDFKDLVNDKLNTKYAYINFDGIKSINSPENDNIFIIIKVATGTTFELKTNTNEEENDKYSYDLCSNITDEEIMAYLISNDLEWVWQWKQHNLSNTANLTMVTLTY